MLEFESEQGARDYFEVAVSVCQCVGVADLAAVGGSWMRAIVDQAANGTRT